MNWPDLRDAAVERATRRMYYRQAALRDAIHWCVIAVALLAVAYVVDLWWLRVPTGVLGVIAIGSCVRCVWEARP